MLDRNRDSNADAVRLSRGALLLDVERPAERIEVIAPQAIASVRGTRWAVDAQARRTSVFVVRGTVDVRRRTGANRVSLNAGDGVDVDTGTGPLTVKRWPAARVAALLARFGQ
jgi:ferric-dicitrate binding protein FerR (iron transport regulator)